MILGKSCSSRSLSFFIHTMELIISENGERPLCTRSLSHHQARRFLCLHIHSHQHSLNDLRPWKAFQYSLPVLPITHPPMGTPTTRCILQPHSSHPALHPKTRPFRDPASWLTYPYPVHFLQFHCPDRAKPSCPSLEQSLPDSPSQEVQQRPESESDFNVSGAGL